MCFVEGDEMEETALFKKEELESCNALLVLKEVKEILEEKGYHAINQIAAYLLSGDPSYISNYKDASDKLLAIDRVSLVAYLLKEYLK